MAWLIQNIKFGKKVNQKSITTEPIRQHDLILALFLELTKIINY